MEDTLESKAGFIYPNLSLSALRTMASQFLQKRAAREQTIPRLWFEPVPGAIVVPELPVGEQVRPPVPTPAKFPPHLGVKERCYILR